VVLVLFAYSQVWMYQFEMYFMWK